MGVSLSVRVSRPATGQCELVVNGQHFHRIVREGILAAKVSLDIATADFKAMLVPEAGTRRAKSIVEVMRRLAGRRGGDPADAFGHAELGGAAGVEEGLPENLVIRRCPRLHFKAVVIDSQRMYVGRGTSREPGSGPRERGSGILNWGCGRKGLG